MKVFLIKLFYNSDHSTKLRKATFENKAFEMQLYRGTKFEVSREDLDSAIDNSLITSNTFYAWLFNYNTIKDGKSNYYLDFDLVLSSGLDIKISNMYNKLNDIFTLVPNGNTLKAQFLGRTTVGIDSRYTISAEKSTFTGGHFPDTFIRGLFDTKFFDHEIAFNPNDDTERSHAIISMLLLMLMEPNVFVNIKVDEGTNLNPGDNFLNLDIYELYDNSIFQEGSVPNAWRIGGDSVWSQTEAGATLTQDNFNELKNAFDAIIQYRDIKYFNGFHNHEQDKKYATMFDYVKAKIHNRFLSLGILSPTYGLYDLRNKIFPNLINFGDFSLHVAEYFTQEIIDDLRNLGIYVDEDRLIGATRNTLDNRYARLEVGDFSAGFYHILRDHRDHFWSYYQLLDYYDIAKFILDTISNEPVYGYYPGRDPSNQGLVYHVNNRYFRVLISPDGFIISAFPPTENTPFPDYVVTAGTGVVL